MPACVLVVESRAVERRAGVRKCGRSAELRRMLDWWPGIAAEQPLAEPRAGLILQNQQSNPTSSRDHRICDTSPAVDQRVLVECMLLCQWQGGTDASLSTQLDACSFHNAMSLLIEKVKVKEERDGEVVVGSNE